MRNFKIDFLRFIGLSLIILAHVHAPWLLTQFRSFDVPLMIFISGLCLKHINGSIFIYIWNRIKRLYIPTFIFLSIYFLLIGCVWITGIRIPYTIEQVIGSFLLLQKPSIGYVWIIRIFILMACIAPLLQKLYKKIGTSRFVFLIIALFIVDTIAVNYLPKIQNVILNLILVDYILYTIGYGIILMFSMVIRNLNSIHQKYIFNICVLILLSSILYLYYTANWIPISIKYKYPPQTYFIIYGLLCCGILHGININAKESIICEIIRYISIHSIWIYLWHIPFIDLIDYISSTHSYWFIEWLLSYSGAILIVFIQNKIVNMSLKQGNELKKYLT